LLGGADDDLIISSLGVNFINAGAGTDHCIETYLGSYGTPINCELFGED